MSPPLTPDLRFLTKSAYLQLWIWLIFQCFFFYKDPDLFIYLLRNNTVRRTAPATPGILVILNKIFAMPYMTYDIWGIIIKETYNLSLCPTVTIKSKPLGLWNVTNANSHSNGPSPSMHNRMLLLILTWTNWQLVENKF